MGFCTWGNEVPSERGRICQNCRDWFAISRKLVQTFFVEFHFFYGNHVIFLFPFWPLIKVYFLFSCKCFCDVLFWRIMMMMGLPFCRIIHGFFRFHENWKMKKYKNTRNNLIESALELLLSNGIVNAVLEVKTNHNLNHPIIGVKNDI